MSTSQLRRPAVGLAKDLAEERTLVLTKMLELKDSNKPSNSANNTANNDANIMSRPQFGIRFTCHRLKLTKFTKFERENVRNGHTK